MAAQPVLATRGLSLGFGSAGSARSVLSDLLFEVPEREFVCIVGPSGCGKTTLLRLLAGLLPASGGETLFQGRRVTAPQPDIAIVFQDYGRALLPWRTVAGNIALAFEARAIPKSEHASLTEPLRLKMGLAQHAENGAVRDARSGGGDLPRGSGDCACGQSRAHCRDHRHRSAAPAQSARSLRWRPAHG